MRFARYIGIDYSGAGSSNSRQPGLRAFVADQEPPKEASNPAGGRSGRWSRDALHRWLLDTLLQGPATAIGIDHAFSLPAPYFEAHQIDSWDALLEHLTPQWRLSGADDTVGKRQRARSDAFYQTKRRDLHPLRLTETWSPTARSVFDFQGQGSVAYSTHAGLVYLHDLRRALGEQLHIWPFDGWLPPPDVHVAFEVYPSMLRRRFEDEMTHLNTTDQKDAYAISKWLQVLDQEDHWHRYLDPVWPDTLKGTAELEGWIFGVG